MSGWVVVGAPALSNSEDLMSWIERGLATARALPPR